MKSKEIVNHYEIVFCGAIDSSGQHTYIRCKTSYPIDEMFNGCIAPEDQQYIDDLVKQFEAKLLERWPMREHKQNT